MPVSHHDGIGIVLLAAGESRRMATSSQTPAASQMATSSEAAISSQMTTPKALLPWLGRPLIQYQLEQIAAQGAAHVVVVTGFHAKRLVPYIESFAGVRIVENLRPRAGQSFFNRARRECSAGDTDRPLL